MDVQFSVANWQPTKPPEPGDALLSSAFVSRLCTKLNDQTTDILQHPYDPNTWLRRAVTLSRLRYPELAVGDAHKATLLCQSHLSRLQKDNSWSMGYRMGFWMHGEDEKDQRTEVLNDCLKKLQERAHRTEMEHTELFIDDPEGRFRRRAYPWMSDLHRKRSDELLKSINAEFASNTTNESGHTFCTLKRHAFGEGVGRSDTSNLLGVFAACDVAEGAIILRDTTQTWGCNGPGTHFDG